MSRGLEQELYKAAAATFEELGFLFPSQDDDEETQCEAVAGVRFFGPVSGRLVVTARGGLLSVLASNMLGEEDTARVQQYDALGEVANVICGNVLPSIGGSQAIFQIEAPRVMCFTDSVSSIGQPTASVSLSLDEGQSDVMLFVEERMAA